LCLPAARISAFVENAIYTDPMTLLIGLLATLAAAITAPILLLWFIVRAVLLWRACVPPRRTR
jgi:hypothetical protein